MRVLLTGMNGTVAPAIAATLAHRGVEIAAWSRRDVPVDDPGTMRTFLAGLRPSQVVHAALGPPEWAQALALLCREASIPFTFISTVSVFSCPPDGPYAPETRPNAEDDYGRYKRACEGLVREASADAAIVRIGWQIGTSRGSNNMVDWCEREMESRGRVEANRNWTPSCSFLDQTAIAFSRFLANHRSGIYHIEGNSTGLAFPGIVRGLARIHGSRWRIEEADGMRFDNRLANSLPVRRPVAELLPAES